MENQVATTELEAGATTRTTGHAWLTLRIISAAALMGVAANCFLKYLWWAACYSAWYGIPKYARQWKAAGSRVSLYGWGLIMLEAASIAVIFSLTAPRSNAPSRFFRNGVRFTGSIAVTIVGTALLAWALSWIKQGTP
jgi:hypothetical protein